MLPQKMCGTYRAQARFEAAEQHAHRKARRLAVYLPNDMMTETPTEASPVSLQHGVDRFSGRFFLCDELPGEVQSLKMRNILRVMAVLSPVVQAFGKARRRVTKRGFVSSTCKVGVRYHFFCGRAVEYVCFRIC